MTVENYRDFQAELTRVVQPFIVASIDNDRQKFRAVIKGILENSKENRSFKEFTRRDEIFVSRFYLEFDEIVTSHLCMKDIEIYIKRFPYRDAGVSSLRYLKYHIVSHLNEIYLYQERIKAFLEFIQKRYRKNFVAGELNLMAQNILELIKSSLRDVILTRGIHVHEKRFTTDDFDKLIFLENLKKSEADTFEGLYELECTQARKKWAKIIHANNLVMEQLLNLISKELYSILFDENGQIIFPDTK